MAMTGKGVEKAVASVIVRLLGRTENGGNRRKADEVFERQFAGGHMQIPGTDHLRMQDPVETPLVQLDYEFIVQDHGTVNHSLERRALRLDVVDHSPYILGASHVATHIAHVDPCGL